MDLAAPAAPALKPRHVNNEPQIKHGGKGIAGDLWTTCQLDKLHGLNKDIFMHFMRTF